MKLIVDQSPEHREVKITIECGAVDSELERLIAQIRLFSHTFTGKKDGKSYMIRLEKIFYFETIDEKTFLYTQNEVYECGMRLYEVEERLQNTGFVRISKSCILNTARLCSVRALLNGRLEAELSNREKLIINRHYVQAVKEKLEL